jgi:O-Antigen ligase
MTELAVERPRIRSRLHREPAREALIAGLGGFAIVAGLAAAQGGYFPTTWGWSAFVLFAAALIALGTRRQLSLGPAQWTMIGGILALVGWIALSTIWSTVPAQSMLETERALVYAGGVLAALVLIRRRSVAHLLGGILAAITLIAVYAVADRLLVNHVGPRSFGGRLAGPLGYWNALGIFAAIGILLAGGFAARGSSPVARALAAASAVPLAVALYLTFSRGSTLSLAVGLAVAVAYDRRRLQLVSALGVVAIAPLTAVWLASRSHDLTSSTAPPVGANTTHYALAGVLVGLAFAAALAATALWLVESRASFGRRLRTAYAATLIAILVLALAGAFAHYGSPPTLVHKAYASFKGDLKSSNSLNSRLLSLSNHYRLVAWRAAWHDYKAHPLLGSGAGSFEQYWLQHRTSTQQLVDAHNLYAETLAELGAVGFALLGLVLSLPLLAAVRARSHPLAAVALGGYLALLVHAAGDWDWEMPVVMLVGLLLGVALLVMGSSETGRRTLPSRVLVPLLAIAVAGAAFAVVGFVGNNAISDARAAIAAENWAEAENDARKAADWAPWSDVPWQLLGDGQVGEKSFGAARGSFEHAVSVNPNNWLNWYFLGTVTAGEARQEAYRMASLLNPLDPRVVLARKLAD